MPLSILCCLLLMAPRAAEPEKLALSVAGLSREALVVRNSVLSSSDSPLIFAFHGHGGTARHALRTFELHKLWPEAIVVYLQGLPGVQGITDPDGKKPGWQKNPGEQQDRDVKFFDALLAKLLQEYPVDKKRIYAMGHSNGSRFVCVLMKMRGETFAAVATSGGQGGGLWRDIKPIPILAMAGEKDPFVPFAGQKLIIETLAKHYQIDANKTKKNGFLSQMHGKNGVEMDTFYHPGGHQWIAEMNSQIVSFFKRQQKK
jgi:polyhydroxybutyrate depolymerase